jgi:CheY-like chemotaxis protein
MRQTILLIDDDLDDVLFFEMAISRCAPNIDVVHAHDGAQALEMLKRGNDFVPDLIVTDLKMSGINGFEFLALLKADLNLNRLPVIVFSSSDEGVDRQRVMRFAANGYHVKPVGHHQLVEEVTRIYNMYLSGAVRDAGALGDVQQILGHPTPALIRVAARSTF